MDIIEYINEAKIRKVGGISYTDKDLCSALMYDVERIIEENDLDEVSIIELWVNGSRMRGDYRPDSDIDVVVFYCSDITKEDSLFNILNGENIEIEGHKIDFNPILVYNERDIKKYKEKSNRYDQEKLKKQCHS